MGLKEAPLHVRPEGLIPQFNLHRYRDVVPHCIFVFKRTGSRSTLAFPRVSLNYAERGKHRRQFNSSLSLSDCRTDTVLEQKHYNINRALKIVGFYFIVTNPEVVKSAL